VDGVCREKWLRDVEGLGKKGIWELRINKTSYS
jgi:hypothetical protein